MAPATLKKVRKYLRKEFKPASLKEASYINYLVAIQRANEETIAKQLAIIERLEMGEAA